MRKAKNFIMIFLACLPVLWFFLVCTTGIMGDRKPIGEYSFGYVLVSSGSISYTSGSAAEAVLSNFIPAGSSVSDLSGPVSSLYNLGVWFSDSGVMPGVGSAPSALVLCILLYLFYLFVLESLSLVVNIVCLPVRLCCRWLESVG